MTFFFSFFFGSLRENWQDKKDNFSSKSLFRWWIQCIYTSINSYNRVRRKDYSWWTSNHGIKLRLSLICTLHKFPRCLIILKIGICFGNFPIYLTLSFQVSFFPCHLLFHLHFHFHRLFHLHRHALYHLHHNPKIPF